MVHLTIDRFTNTTWILRKLRPLEHEPALLPGLAEVALLREVALHLPRHPLREAGAARLPGCEAVHGEALLAERTRASGAGRWQRRRGSGVELALSCAG